MADRRDPVNGMGEMGTGLTIAATLLSGLLVWGGVGYLVDHWLGTPKVFTALGMVVGAAAAIYLVWLKYGRDDGRDARS
jgi:F0F1-type ATP synthase assembly protein I